MPPGSAPLSHPSTMADTQTPTLSLESTGGGWYEIRRGDEVLDKVQGKDEAQARLAELAGDDSADSAAEKAAAEKAAAEKAAAEKAAAEKAAAGEEPDSAGDNVPYRMASSGGTVGAVTGKNRVWRKGQVVVAPEGEFAHLGDGEAEAVSAAELKAAAKTEKAVTKPSR